MVINNFYGKGITIVPFKTDSPEKFFRLPDLEKCESFLCLIFYFITLRVKRKMLYS